jgi:ABC-type transport system involved in cytochrome bd biosynthesis fused ATPase/permease subunit
MGIALSDIIGGTTQNYLLGSISSPIFATILTLIIVIVIILISYRSKCALTDHIAPLLIITVILGVIFAVYGEAVKQKCEKEYKNDKISEVKQGFYSALPDRSSITPQTTKQAAVEASQRISQVGDKPSPPAASAPPLPLTTTTATVGI